MPRCHKQVNHTAFQTKQALGSRMDALRGCVMRKVAAAVVGESVRVEVRELPGEGVCVTVFVPLRHSLRMTPAMTTPISVRGTEARSTHNPLPEEIAGRISPEENTLAFLVQRHLADMKRRELAPKYIRDNARMLSDFLDRSGITHAHQLTTDAIVEHMDYMQAKGIGAKYRKDFRACIDRLCKRMVRAKLLADNPIVDVPDPKVIQARARIVPSGAELVKLITTAAESKSPSRWLRYLTAATSSLRPSSMDAIDWSWITWHEDDDGPAWIEVPAKAMKTKRPHIAFLTKETAMYLHRAWCELGKPASGRMFRVLDHEDFNRDVRKAGLLKRRAEGGASLSPYSLRHFAATFLTWASSNNDATIARHLSHSKPGITRRVYIDAASLDYGRKIWNLQALLPCGFTALVDATGAKYPPVGLDRSENVRHDVPDETKSELNHITHSQSFAPDGSQTPLFRHFDRSRESGTMGCEHSESGSDASGLRGSAPETLKRPRQDSNLPGSRERQELLELSVVLRAIASRLLKELGDGQPSRTDQQGD